MTNIFFTHTKTGQRVWVNTDNNRVKIHGRTHTSNPHQPSHKWFQTARPKDAAAYAAKKVASGEWTPEVK